MPATTTPVLDYIRSHWSKTFYRDQPGQGFCGMDLPHPYVSPCIRGEGHFTFFFYWDTYFTQLGLLRDGHAEMAKNNIRNILWFIRRQGYMPNHTAVFNRSQSPYFCKIVQDYLAATGDESFLPECAEGLRQEYHFCSTAPISPIGLNRHGHHDTDDGLVLFYDQIRDRLGLPADAPRAEKTRAAAHYMATAEASCDFTQRFGDDAMGHCAVDLNALLFEYESYLATVAPKLGWDDQALWESRRARRLELMNRHLWSEERGFFLDYDFVHSRPSPVAAVTGYQPLFHGIATPAQAARMVACLPLFEREHGLAYTESTSDCRLFQWAYPAVWPCMVYMVVAGLRRYGYEAEARRIARKYQTTTERLFARTGRLWEKTDAETGDTLHTEYASAPLLGWTAGVYVALHEYLASPPVSSLSQPGSMPAASPRAASLS